MKVSKETQAIVDAITSLKVESNLVVDYLIPVLSIICSALIGFVVAYFTLLHQEKISIQKERIKEINDWSVMIHEAMLSLIAIKNNYIGKLNSDPLRRTLSIPSIIGDHQKLDKNTSGLAFVASIGNYNGIEKELLGWAATNRVYSMIHNYNSLLDIWDKRSQLERPIKEGLVKEYGKYGYAEIPSEVIEEIYNKSEVVSLMELTELAISLTDGLIIEMKSFTVSISEIGKKLIKKSYIKKYGPVLIYDYNANKKLQPFFEVSPKVDYDMLVKLTGKPLEYFEKKYDFTYQKV